MRVVIDCFKQVKGVGKSIGIYNLTLNLARNLVKYQEASSDINIKMSKIIILGNVYNKDDFDISGLDFVEVSEYNALNKLDCVYWELFAVNKYLKRLKADCVLYPRGYCALSHPIADIVTINDLIPFYYNKNFPEAFNKIENAYIMHRMKKSAKTSARIITISEASKKEIIDNLGVNKEKISVIHCGCNAMSYTGERNAAEQPYICAVTSGLPHKNAKGIFKAYEEYCRFTENALNLVVIGVGDTLDINLSDDIREKIACYKYIQKNSEMHKIIANSTVFMFLSLIEGFGFPPLEAMQLRVPVICSNTSSLPEVVGDSAILVDPTDYKGIAVELDSIIKDKERQELLIAKGQDNVKRFSWDSRAELYWRAFLNVVEER